jgi:hypothetical protein
MDTIKIKLSYVFLLSMIVLLTACKKDAMEVKEEKRFVQVNAAPSDPMFGGVSLTLRPNGVGTINPGGDIVWPASYKIRGNKLSMKVQEINSEFKFTIVSSEELHGSNGEVLKLEK